MALRKKRHYQKAIDLLIPKPSFGRLVREILYDLIKHNALKSGMKDDGGYQIQSSALLALQEVTEAFLCEFLASKCTTHLR